MIQEALQTPDEEARTEKDLLVRLLRPVPPDQDGVFPAYGKAQQADKTKNIH
ncbi:hypothetical protein [Parapedobacter tibetensis]|uniref:hypothetical protein n=1 Tax=Parapedobacter tibetensis TaxID=2972951 RepID=UPI00214D1701|nr:hypothetical protein [Parapedobacter tibetensis]